MVPLCIPNSRSIARSDIPLRLGFLIAFQLSLWRDVGLRPEVAGRISPALSIMRWPSKATWMRSGWLRGSIFRVLLVCGRFCVTETIILEAQEHFLTSSARCNTHVFCGLGLKEWRISRESRSVTTGSSVM